MTTPPQLEVTQEHIDLALHVAATLHTRSVYGRLVDVEELQSEALLQLALVAREYDPERSDNVRAFVVVRTRQRLLDWLRNEYGRVRIEGAMPKLRFHLNQLSLDAPLGEDDESLLGWLRDPSEPEQIVIGNIEAEAIMHALEQVTPMQRMALLGQLPGDRASNARRSALRYTGKRKLAAALCDSNWRGLVPMALQPPREQEPAMQQWKTVPGFEGYQVSDDGQVRSLRTRGKRVLAAHPSTRGYLMVVLSRAGQRCSKSVHRLVLGAFVGPPEPGQVARHLNGDQTDNRLLNLRWGTQRENVADTRAHGRLPVGEANGKSRLTEADVVVIRRLDAVGQSGQTIARLLGVSNRTVSDVLTGRSWSHVGEQVGA